MKLSLKDMIEIASRVAGQKFINSGEIFPMYHAIREDGAHMIIPAPEYDDKDKSAAIIRALFAREKVTSYVFMNEAWELRANLSPEEIEQAIKRGLHKHPDRREIVMFSAENKQGEMLTATRYILRPEHGKPTLSPLKFNDLTGAKSEGRMVGLLGKAES